MMMGSFRFWAGLAFVVSASFLDDAPACAGVLEGGIDLLELHPGRGPDHLLLESTFQAGSGVEHFAIKIDGGSETRAAMDNVQVQGLWMPQPSNKLTLAFGVRQDFRSGSGLTHAVAGIEANLLPWLDGEHYLFVSERGDITGGAKLTANWRLAEKWRLEPRVQINWAARDIPLENLASGATDMQASARLRRSLGNHADVYVGVAHERLLGGTAEIARQTDGHVHVTRAVIGVGLSL